MAKKRLHASMTKNLIRGVKYDKMTSREGKKTFVAAYWHSVNS